MTALILLAAFVLASRVYAVNGITAADVSAVLSSLVKFDGNAAGQSDVTIKYQNMASGKTFKDNSVNPLFTSVSDRINQGPTFIALRELQALYQTPDIHKEDTSSFTRRAVSHAFIDAIFYTAVMQKAWLFLGQAGLVSLDAQTFKNHLYEIWFEEYARENATGSSGFETIFVGEVNGTKVVGLNNWYRFYQLEMKNMANYYGWFDRAKDVHITLQFAWESSESFRNSFLVGCSPEFEIAAYTICALSQKKECVYDHTGYRLSINIETITPPGKTMKIKSLRITQYTAATTPKVTPSQKTTTKRVNNVRLQNLVDEMRAADIDRPVDYLVNWGNKAANNSDVSPEPMYKFVNESLFEQPVYKTLIDVYNSGYFIPDVCGEEVPLTAAGGYKTLITKMFDAFTNTTVFQLALDYLKEIHYITDWASFRETLWSYWFGTYTRCKGPLGSSGFEHVFVGEWKDSKISGQHGWVNFYLLEQSGKINYYGYISYIDQLTATVKYTWEKYLKDIGGFNIGTSPAFDFALFSVCALTKTGNNGCRFNIDGNPMAVTSFLQSCGNGIDTCIATAYATN